MVDLVLDFPQLQPNQVATVTLAATTILKTLPHAAAWRSVVVAGTGFPETLSGFDVAVNTRLRAE